jgi:hypothetical protein
MEYVDLVVLFVLGSLHLCGVYVIFYKRYVVLLNQVQELHAEIAGLSLLLSRQESVEPSSGVSTEPGQTTETIIPSRVCMSVRGNCAHTLSQCPALRFSKAETLRHGDNILCTWCRVRTNNSWILRREPPVIVKCCQRCLGPSFIESVKKSSQVSVATELSGFLVCFGLCFDTIPK